MLKEAIDRILSLADARTFTFEDRSYTDKPLHPVQDPRPTAVKVRTLTGFCDLLTANLEKFDAAQCVIHVESFDAVSLIGRTSDIWGRRPVYVRAELEEVQGFPFDSFMASELFAIRLQARFVPAVGDLDELARIASTITAENILTSEDDGMSQKVAVRQGIALKEQVTVKRRVSLAPYRTFREVTQPVSDFVFRVKQEQPGAIPSCALFEADGGKWKLDAMLAIKSWLEGKNVGIPVAA